MPVPPGVVTETLTGAAMLPAGVTAVRTFAETTFTLVAATPPTVTLLAPKKFVPFKVMVVPPLVKPDAGEMAVTVGAGQTPD